MATSWTAEQALERLERRLDQVAPGNTAPFPVTLTNEWTLLGKRWVIDIHVRIRGVTEYELTTSDKHLAVALRKAVVSLNSESRIRRSANWANERFGVAV